MRKPFPFGSAKTPIHLAGIVSLCQFALLFVFLLPVLSGFAGAQAAKGVRNIPTIFVDSLGNGGAADAMRKRLIDQIQKSGSVRVVNDAKTADAVLHGSAVIWPTGTISNNPRSNSSRQTIYQGYLSVELTDPANRTLWSYLATPSHFRTASIVDDLADQFGSKFVGAIKSGIFETPAPSTAKSGAGIALRAAGATFPAPLYQKWFDSFGHEPGGFSIAYDAVGSVAGIDQLAAGKVDIAASDIPWEKDAGAPQMEVLSFPAVVGGVVPIYNLPNVEHGLNLTPELLADIYSGKIRKWNDERIRRWNSSAHLPDSEISVVHRSDGSGTTYVWTSFLSEASPDWKGKTGATVEWPVGVGAVGNEGVVEQVEKTPNSIGYVELIYAIQHQLNYAAVRNPAGRFIKADLASITAAATDAHSAGREPRFSILNSPIKDAYPITTFTWFLVPKTSSDSQRRAAIARFLRWMLTTGQKQSSSFGYAPLPREMVNGELQAVDALK
jgi:phosphate ABC transporter phosphate-binding protein